MTNEWIVSAFPATGKTTVATSDRRFVDSDSSKFGWSEPGVRNPEWPSNYIAHIDLARMDGHRVLVSSHGEVRAALADAGVPFALVYPDVSLREEYRARMIMRGSPLPLVKKVIEELWEPALAECAAQEGCEHIVLGRGQFLADVLA